LGVDDNQEFSDEQATSLGDATPVGRSSSMLCRAVGARATMPPSQPGRWRSGGVLVVEAWLRMIVVPDTNIWLKELALNSGLGSAVRFFLKQRGASIGLPQVVEMEVKTNARRMIEEAIERANRSARELGSWFGQLHEMVLPRESQVDEMLDSLFSRMGAAIVPVPFTFESATASFLKTIRKEAPSVHDQQFKDGVLWADCLTLLRSADVCLITPDKAFYADREYKKGLAKTLLAEAAAVSEASGKTMRVFSGLEELLPLVKARVEIDRGWLLESLLARAHQTARANAIERGFDFDGHPVLSTLRLSATEKDDVLFFAYDVQVPCKDITAGGRVDAAMVLAGDGTLRVVPQDLIEVNVTGQRLTFTNPNRLRGEFSWVFGRAEAYLGHKVITHSARYLLDED
jgi:hypothetical protein